MPQPYRHAADVDILRKRIRELEDKKYPVVPLKPSSPHVPPDGRSEAQVQRLEQRFRQQVGSPLLLLRIALTSSEKRLKCFGQQEPWLGVRLHHVMFWIQVGSLLVWRCAGLTPQYLGSNHAELAQ